MCFLFLCVTLCLDTQRAEQIFPGKRYNEDYLSHRRLITGYSALKEEGAGFTQMGVHCDCLTTKKDLMKSPHDYDSRS